MNQATTEYDVVLGAGPGFQRIRPDPELVPGSNGDRGASLLGGECVRIGPGVPSKPLVPRLCGFEARQVPGPAGGGRGSLWWLMFCPTA